MGMRNSKATIIDDRDFTMRFEIQNSNNQNRRKMNSVDLTMILIERNHILKQTVLCELEKLRFFIHDLERMIDQYDGRCVLQDERNDLAVEFYNIDEIYVTGEIVKREVDGSSSYFTYEHCIDIDKAEHICESIRQMINDFEAQMIGEDKSANASNEIEDKKTDEYDPVANMPAMNDYLFKNWMRQILRTLQTAKSKNTKEETDQVLEELIESLYTDM